MEDEGEDEYIGGGPFDIGDSNLEHFDTAVFETESSDTEDLDVPIEIPDQSTLRLGYGQQRAVDGLIYSKNMA